MQIVIRPTRRTGDRLSVKSPVDGIYELLGTIFVERPPLHRGIGTVVRQAKHDGVTRATVRTVYVGITVTWIVVIEKLFEAVFTYRQIGRNPGRRLLAVLALPDRKPVHTKRRDRPNLHFCN